MLCDISALKFIKLFFKKPLHYRLFSLLFFIILEAIFDAINNFGAKSSADFCLLSGDYNELYYILALLRADCNHSSNSAKALSSSIPILTPKLSIFILRL